ILLKRSRGGNRLILREEAGEEIAAISTAPQESQFSTFVGILKKQARAVGYRNLMIVHLESLRNRYEHSRITYEHVPEGARIGSTDPDNAKHQLETLVERKAVRDDEL